MVVAKAVSGVAAHNVGGGTTAVLWSCEWASLRVEEGAGRRTRGCRTTRNARAEALTGAATAQLD